MRAQPQSTGSAVPETAEPRPAWAPPPISDQTATRVVLGLILVGCGLRLLWAVLGRLEPINSEAYFIARALAEGRGFAEAFGAGTGPTAHLMPLTPLPAALAYVLLGSGAPAAEFVLTLWALLCVGASFFLAERILREMGATPWARILGVTLVAFAPLQISLEASTFRVWEGALATAALLAMVLAIMRLDGRPRIGWVALVGIGLGNAAIFLISPAAAIASSGVIGIFFLRKVPPMRWPVPVLVAMAVVAAVVVPWGLRNQAVLGEFAPLRTGEGISLAMAYHDGRVSPTDIQAADLARFREVSPLMGEEARRLYLSLGEVEFNRLWSDEARAWRQAHPAEVWKIRARNFLEFYAPPAWLWTRFTTQPVSAAIEARRWFVLALSVVAALTLVHALVTQRGRWLYLGAALLLPSLPYIATYPLLRYRYLVSTLLIMVAAYGVVRLADHVARRVADSRTRKAQPA